MNQFANSITSITFKHSFKKVRSESDPKFGQVRDAIQVSFISAAAQLPDFPEEKLIVLLNDSLTQFAKKRILENANDWNYIPSEDEITLENLYTDLTTQTARTRILTAKNLATWEIEFASLATLAGKSQAFIQTVSVLAKEKFIRLSDPENHSRLLNVAKFLTELEFRGEIPSAVNDKLLEIITGIIETPSVSADLTLDSLD